MIWFYYFCKKKFFFFCMAHWGTPFLQKLDQKMVILARGFSALATGKLLISIESLNIFHWKTAQKIKVDVVLGQSLGQIRSTNVKKEVETGIYK